MKMRVTETWSELDGIRSGLEVIVICDKAAVDMIRMDHGRSLEFIPRVGGFFEEATPIKMRVKSVEWIWDDLGNERLEIWMNPAGPHAFREKAARVKSEIKRRSMQCLHTGERIYCMDWPEAEVPDDVFTPARSARLDLSGIRTEAAHG